MLGEHRDALEAHACASPGGRATRTAATPARPGSPTTFALDLERQLRRATSTATRPAAADADVFEDVYWMAEAEAFAKDAIRDFTGQPSAGRAPASRRRHLVQQPRPVDVLHAELDDAGRAAAGEGVLRGRRLRRQHRVAHRGRHARDRRPRPPAAGHPALRGRGVPRRERRRCTRSTSARPWRRSRRRSLRSARAAGCRPERNARSGRGRCRRRSTGSMRLADAVDSVESARPSTTRC